jgi:hypothetical protein
MINGKRYAWEDLEIFLPHGVLIDVSKVEYSDEKEYRPVYGKGSNPVGFGSGNYKAEGKLSLLREEFDKLVAYCATQKLKGIYSLPPFVVTLTFANENEKISVTRLKGVKLTKRSSSIDQGAEKSEVELDFLILDGVEDNAMDANAEKSSVLGTIGAIGGAINQVIPR